MKIYISGEESIKNEILKMFSAELSDSINDSVDIIIEANNFPKETKLENIKRIDEESGKKIPVFTSSLCVPVYEQCTASKYPERLIGIGLYNGISDKKRIEIVPSKVTGSGILKSAEDFLKQLKINYSIVPDRSGLVFPRIVSMIINEAAQVYAEQTAGKEDIDTAMKLGTNYPNGPLEWADKMGVDLIYNILLALYNEFHEDRYRPHPLLKEMYALGLKFY
jgi:3-hydroxybutyryl-CoA dehydrogenase